MTESPEIPPEEIEALLRKTEEEFWLDQVGSALGYPLDRWREATAPEKEDGPTRTD